ncbi:DUF4238 domain-containing protein [Lysobacter sp. 22409]|uniref:DUF4238 domain-containing protein n=1 Tax=Lysobacter sp. 22409 TaxID=3453917 RepID=UPI003F85FC24
MTHAHAVRARSSKDVMGEAMQQLHKVNHYVPQLYLKQWATGNDIRAYRLLVPHHSCPLWKRQSLRGIAQHQHLYTQIVGGKETDEFERWLDTNFESPAEEAISLAVNDQPLTSDHYRTLVRFAVAQSVRTPAGLREFLQRQKTVLPALLQQSVDCAAQRIETERVIATSSSPSRRNAGDFPLKVSIIQNASGEATLQAETVSGRGLWIWSLKHLLTSTVDKVPYAGWSILRAPPGLSWPTSDNPLVRLRFISRSNYSFDGGWRVPRGDIFLPLGPRHLLHQCVGRRSFPRGHMVDPDTAKMFRRMIVEHADRYVFAAHDQDIHDVRVRRVCAATYEAEREAWENWHAVQTSAESELLNR